MKNFKESLEFDKVLSLVQKHCQSELAIFYVRNLLPFKHEADLAYHLTLFKEMRDFILRYQEISDLHSSSLSFLKENSQSGEILNIEELEKVAADTIISKNIIENFSLHNEEFPLLNRQISSLKELSYLENLIHQVIAPNLTIFDTASNELKKIRLSLKSLEQEVSHLGQTMVKTYEEYLIDRSITLRNGHYVLPVKINNKHKVEGIIHDYSSSGNTVFIEPIKIVELNNKIASLKMEEENEIYRILRSLSTEVFKEKEALLMNNKVIAHLDYLTAKVRFMHEYHAVIAEIPETRMLSLKSARHPLLPQDKVVANDFYLDEQKHLLIISGPNAGGKSVALKTVGVLAIMHNSALPVLACEGAKIPFFKSIYVDIGDQQSLNDSLSTFSGHMDSLINLTRHLGSKDLVLIDELGTGTDPLEGEALAKSVLDFLHFKRSFGLITSHFNGVKTYALDKDYVMNASMIFNEENFTPTYHLRLGIPGKSYGILVAKRLGLHDSIITKANKYLSVSNAKGFNDALEKIDCLLKQTEQKKEEYQQLLSEIKIKEQNLKKQEIELFKRKENLMQEVEEEKEAILKQTEVRIKDIMDNLNHPEIKLHEVINARKKLEELNDNAEEENIQDNNFKISDYVEIIDMSLQGTIIRLTQGKYIVQTSLGNITVEGSNLQKVARPKISKQVTNTPSRIINHPVSLELNLIGLHVDEALPLLEKYLDDVLVKGYEEVRIIHGSGSGILRKAVHEFLAKQKYIISFRLGGEFEGGVGATVVKLK